MFSRYLVIDDSHVSRALLRAALQAMDPDALVQEAINIRQGRQLLAEGQLPDAIFVDVVLPDGDGFELAKTLRAELPQLRMALYTSRLELKTGADTIQAAFLEKPLQAAALSEFLALQPAG